MLSSPLSPLALLALAVVVLHVEGKRIGLIGLPEVGHFKPLRNIGEELARLGVEAEFYVLKEFARLSGCRVIADYSTSVEGSGTVSDDYKTWRDENGTSTACIVYGDVEIMHRMQEGEFLKRVTQAHPLETIGEIQENIHELHSQSLPLLLSAVRRRKDSGQAPDLLVVDTGMYAGFSVADALDIPLVSVWLLTLSLPLSTPDWMPHLGLAAPLNMTYLQRFLNFLIRGLAVTTHKGIVAEINRVRAANGITKQLDIYDTWYRHPVITPSVFGLDIPHPLCPSVQPVGFLHNVPKSTPDSIPGETLRWIEDCKASGRGVVYINMGSVAVLSERMVKEMELFAHSTAHCVMWKLPKREQKLLAPLPSSILISDWFTFSPLHLLQRPETKVFVTHCGDTSVAEALSVGVPLVGIPLFADQPDVCARVVDAGVGLQVDKNDFTGGLLNATVNEVIESPSYREKTLKLSRIAKKLGGPAGAAKFIIDVAEDGYDHLLCPHVNMDAMRFYSIDFWMVAGVILGGSWAFLSTAFGWRKHRRVRRDRSASPPR